MSYIVWALGSDAMYRPNTGSDNTFRLNVGLHCLILSNVREDKHFYQRSHQVAKYKVKLNQADPLFLKNKNNGNSEKKIVYSCRN